MSDPTGIILRWNPDGSWMGLYLCELIAMFGLEKLLAGDFEPVYFAGCPTEWRGNRHPKDVARDAKAMWESSDDSFRESQLALAATCWRPGQL